MRILYLERKNVIFLWELWWGLKKYNLLHGKTLCYVWELLMQEMLYFVIHVLNLSLKSFLSHSATSRKVAGSISRGVDRIFH
jgi:hypothetical protein